MDRELVTSLKTAFARQRRRQATRIERDLWHQLRAKRLGGWMFRREAPIGPYVVDFACFAARLVVEADGPLHTSSEQALADRERQLWLEGAGYRVLRFREDDILGDLAGVLDRIRAALSDSPPSPGRLRRPPSPSGGEGSREEQPPSPQFDGASKAATVLVIACGALAREIRAIVAANGLDHIALTCLPADLHNRPERIPEAVRSAVRKARADGYGEILIGYADCGTGGALDRVCAEEGVTRIAGPHCYAFYSGTEVFLAAGDRDMTSFFLTDFLARQFDAFVVKPLGLDRHPELREAYFGHYERIVYLEQAPDPETERAARKAAERLGIEFEKRATGYGDLASFLRRPAA